MRAIFTCAIAVVGSTQLAAADEEPPPLTTLVEILHAQGVITPDQYQQLSLRAAEQERKQEWYDRISLSGDLRTRYDRMEFHGDTRDRGRARFRARLGLAADVNPWADVFLRLESGDIDNRSSNQSFGGNADWGKDMLNITQAYARLSPFRKGELPEANGTWFVNAGRVPNPFRSSEMGRDSMLWDGDINFEGASSSFEIDPVDALNVYLNAGFFVDDENGSSQDPQLAAGQLGASFEAIDHVTVGARSTFYNFGNLTEAFLERGVSGSIGDSNGSTTSSAGNLVGGLDGSTAGGHVNVVEVGGYVLVSYLEDWPIRVYGDWSSNTSARSTPGAGHEDDAWGIGLEFGDPKKYAKIGVGYWHIEANAFPSQFIDSDLFDGITNREGWAVDATREVLANTEFQVTALLSDAIQNGFAFEDSTSTAHRLRLLFDVVYKFK